MTNAARRSEMKLRTVTVTDLPIPEGTVVFPVFVLAYSGGTVEYLEFFFVVLKFQVSLPKLSRSLSEPAPME